MIPSVSAIVVEVTSEIAAESLWAYYSTLLFPLRPRRVVKCADGGFSGRIEIRGWASPLTQRCQGDRRRHIAPAHSGSRQGKPRQSGRQQHKVGEPCVNLQEKGEPAHRRGETAEEIATTRELTWTTSVQINKVQLWADFGTNWRLGALKWIGVKGITWSSQTLLNFTTRSVSDFF